MTPTQQQQFEAWWENEFDKNPNIYDYPRRKLCEMAWSNAILKNEAQEKIRAAVGICGVESVHRALTEFLKTMCLDEYANDFEIQTDGSMIGPSDGSITGSTAQVGKDELAKFVNYCEKENL